MADTDVQWLRRCELILVEGDKALDLSEFRVKFMCSSQDEESPNNATIRVYNLAQDTLNQIRGEYSTVVLQAGYGDNFGVIFTGTIRQYRIGREGNTDTYLDILAADGDIAYNFAVVNQTMKSGSTVGERIAVAVAEMSKHGVKAGSYVFPSTGGILPRGKVLFGMARSIIRSQCQTVGASWSINGGQVVITALNGYQPGEAVVLTRDTGLIGRPEQTAGGIMCKCLLNPKISAGSLVKIDNDSINKTLAYKDGGYLGAFNKWSNAPLNIASLSTDGLYRVYVADYEGDTRGTAFYSNLTLLSIDPIAEQVKDIT
jgi:hypothetical protein